MDLLDKILTEFINEANLAIDRLKKELGTIRTGKASPSLLDNIIVDAYGGQTRLKINELASVNIEGPTTLVINPYDPTVIADIEKAILKSPLHLTPQVKGKAIYLFLPPLSEEQRNNLQKLVSMKIEETKQTLRNFRDNVRKRVKKMFEEKQISEDQRFHFENSIDQEIKKYQETIESLKEKKINELKNL